MKRVAVLGGGPAGAMAAERLASSGLQVTVLDEKLAWEKPCGGGVTYKAYQTYPFLLHNDTPKKVVFNTRLAAPRAGSIGMMLTQPMLIYSRRDLNQMMLDRAARAGADIDKRRVTGLTPAGARWRVETPRGSFDADFCVIATGARNALRHVGTEWTSKDAMVALGYYVPGERHDVSIDFLPNLEGYIWVFPRRGHLSIGICGKGESSASLRARLERFMEGAGISRRDGQFYGHLLPALESQGWRTNRVSGHRWLAVGDAAGLVDPITGEGLYYAFRSGDLASQIVLDDAHAPDQKADAYRRLLGNDFLWDLELASRIARRFFLDPFLLSTVPTRMVQLMRRSPRFLAIMQDLFAGTQDYVTLKSRLLRSLNGTLHEALMSFFLRRVVAGAPVS